MIKEIVIRNFKSIVNATIPLSTFNVMIGANGCGKSNILEAIAFAAASSVNKLDYEYFSNRGIRFADQQLMFPAFEDVDDKEIQISIKDTNGVVDDHKIRYDENSRPVCWVDSSINKMQFLELLKNNRISSVGDMISFMELEKEVFLKDKTVSVKFENSENKLIIKSAIPELNNYIIFSLEESVLRKADDNSRLYPMGRHGEGLFAYLKDLAKRSYGAEIIDEIKENLEVLDWFDDLKISEDQLSHEFNVQLSDHYIKETISTFDQRSTNEGFLYLLFYLTLIISDETPTFFAIENIDASFNPKLCRRVIKLLAELAKKHGKQIIATTHNPSVLNGLDLNDGCSELLVVRRNVDGYTKVNNVETKGDLNMDLSDAWLKGFIGGLPNNF